MKYDIKEISLNNFYENPLVDIAISSNNLNDEQIKDLLKSDLSLSFSDDKCIIDAVNRIKQAKDNNEKVFVAGDYDADGICATTIMKSALDIYGIESGYYIPNRITEGYGLNKEVVKQVKDKGYSLIITVDNGVKAFDALNCAKELGISVIVSDHHLIDEEVPCEVLVHPSLMSDNFESMCGAGVALAISRKLIGNNDFHTALACIATIGDVMPLWKENRNIVKHGLRIINKHKYKVFDYLLDNIEVVSSKDIGFKLVPKLNALGRLAELGNPNDIIRYYFLNDDYSVVTRMKNIIIDVNKQRQTISKNLIQTANNLIDDEPFIIIKSEEFHEGIVGLVAGNISNSLNKPTIIFAIKEGLLKGSGRSIKGFDLHDFLNDGFDEFLSFGGHSQAVGLSIDESNFESFKEKVNTKFKNLEIEEVKDVAYMVDSSDITLENVKQLLYLEPFGQGFKMPNYAITNLDLISYRLLKDKYHKYTFENFDSISFDNALYCENPKVVIGDLSINTLRQNETVSLNLKDIE